MSGDVVPRWTAPKAELHPDSPWGLAESHTRVVLAADHDRIVAEEWTSFNLAAMEAIEKHPLYNEVTDGWAVDTIADLRKPEVEG